MAFSEIYSWFFNGYNVVYLDVGTVSLSDVGSMLFADNWSQVSAVPEPSIIALFGLGLVGIGFARRRRS